MTPKQAELVRTTWDQIVPDADAVARQFYENLFEIDPTAAALFAGTDMDRQRDMLLKALGHVVSHVDRAETLIPALQEMGRRHARYGVEAQHYASVGAALIATLEQGFGTGFTQPIRSAWTAAYAFIASSMQQSESNAPTASA